MEAMQCPALNGYPLGVLIAEQSGWPGDEAARSRIWGQAISTLPSASIIKIALAILSSRSIATSSLEILAPLWPDPVHARGFQNPLYGGHLSGQSSSQKVLTSKIKIRSIKIAFHCST